MFTGNQITAIESAATHPRDWAFNATGYLYWSSPENWEPIPAAKQDSNAVTQAVGNTCFNSFGNINVTVSWRTPCARPEGGACTGANNLTGETCDLGLPFTIKKVTNRRYVVGEIMGAVDIFLGFPGLDRSQGQPSMSDSHFFSVDGGKVRYIHTVSSCVEAVCGKDGAGPPWLLRREYALVVKQGATLKC